MTVRQTDGETLAFLELISEPKIAIFRYPWNHVFSRFLGGPKIINFGINASIGGLNRSELNKESIADIGFIFGWI